jgi:hypothetical protein
LPDSDCKDEANADDAATDEGAEVSMDCATVVVAAATASVFAAASGARFGEAAKDLEMVVIGEPSVGESLGLPS